MAEQAPKKRKPQAGKRITVTLSDEHYAGVVKMAAEDDREPNVCLSRIVRQRLNEIIVQK